jgi:DNA-directed RNA polymerase specialized sigma24 family protein
MKKTCSAVDAVVAFQETGVGFDDVWAEIDSIVDEFARLTLRTLGVRSPAGDDAWAVDDVVQQVAVRLLALGQPGAGGRFDPARAAPGLSGLRGWLWRVVESQSANWTRCYRGGRGLAIVPLSALDWNDPLEDDGVSIEKLRVAKIERPDLLPILEACIDQLPDPFMQRVVWVRLDEELPLRQSAERLGVPPTRVHNTLHAAYPLLRDLLEARGCEPCWLAA